MARSPSAKSPSDSIGRPSPRDREIEALKSRVDELSLLTTRLAEASAIENVLCNGFTSLGELLAPLQDLTPHYRTMDCRQADALRELYAALARPNWRAATGRLALPAEPSGYEPCDERPSYERTAS